MTDGYGGLRDFTNRMLPKEDKFQSGWIDFPNYLKQENPEINEEEVLVEESQAGQYLPLHRQQTTAFQNKQSTLKETAKQEQPFQSFKGSSQQRERGSEWRSFLQSSRSRTPFVPSNVPSILKGIKRSEQQPIDYSLLESKLQLSPEDILVFATEEMPLVEVEEVNTHVTTVRENSNRKKHTEMKYQPAIRKRVAPSEPVIQETLLQPSPDTEKTKSESYALEEPLPLRQRRAMKRSLSWIMEQEQSNENLPYGKE